MPSSIFFTNLTVQYVSGTLCFFGNILVITYNTICIRINLIHRIISTELAQILRTLIINRVPFCPSLFYSVFMAEENNRKLYHAGNLERSVFHRLFRLCRNLRRPHFLQIHTADCAFSVLSTYAIRQTVRLCTLADTQLLSSGR